jgi:shikimate kinase
MELDALRTIICHSDSQNDSKRHLVIALGGGTVMTNECAELVQNNTCCIYLKASVETLVEHLAGEAAGRPMLADADLRTRIETLMQQRAATYEKTAHIIVDTDGRSIDSIADDIIRSGSL